MQISSIHFEHVSSRYPVISNLNNEQNLGNLRFFSKHVFLIMIRILSLIHQFHSPKMLDIYQCYLEMVLRSTAVAILTLQIDGARTRNQENNSI